MLQKVMKNKENPVFFEKMMCHCGETEGLLKHKFTDEVRCVDCIQKMVEIIERENDSNERDELIDYSHNELLAYRNS